MALYFECRININAFLHTVFWRFPTVGYYFSRIKVIGVIFIFILFEVIFCYCYNFDFSTRRRFVDIPSGQNRQKKSEGVRF